MGIRDVGAMHGDPAFDSFRGDQSSGKSSHRRGMNPACFAST